MKPRKLKPIKMPDELYHLNDNIDALQTLEDQVEYLKSIKMEFNIYCGSLKSLSDRQHDKWDEWMEALHKRQIDEKLFFYIDILETELSKGISDVGNDELEKWVTYDFDMIKIGEYIKKLEDYDKIEKYLNFLLEEAKKKSLKKDYVKVTLEVLSELELKLDIVKFSSERIKAEVKKIPQIRDKAVYIGRKNWKIDERISQKRLEITSAKIQDKDPNIIAKMKKHIDALTEFKEEIYEELFSLRKNLFEVDRFNVQSNNVVKKEEERNFKLDEKIRWLGTEVQLVYLFAELARQNYLPNDFFSVNERGYKIIANIFQNKKGKDLTNKQLHQANQNYLANKRGKPENLQKIELIFEELLKST